MSRRISPVIPGFGLTLGYTLVYLSLLVLIPLGAMFVHAAQALGYRTVVLDPDPESPAGLVAHEHIQADYLDEVGFAALGIDPGRSHRAEADVLTTRALFDRLLVALAPANARELQAIRAGVPVGDGSNSGPPDRPQREAIVAQCVAAIAEKRPLQLAYRPSRRPEILLAVVVRR